MFLFLTKYVPVVPNSTSSIHTYYSKYTFTFKKLFENANYQASKRTIFEKGSL